MRNFELPGRSTVMSCNGMAATSHPLASQTAISILQAGGNAMDAAVAACAVQCVVEPQSTGIGGDCFMLYAPQGSADIVAYNGSGRAPAAADVNWYLEHDIDTIERHSPHAVTIPGAVDAWCRLIADHGVLSLAEVLAPAIRLAREGYPITARVASDWARETDLLASDPAAARILLAQGASPVTGSKHQQPELAATLENIAKQGRDGFYQGPVAEDIVTTLQDLGGLHTLDDFAAACGEYVEPIQTDYRGYQVFECPPNGQGIAALQMLNILEGFDLAALDPLGAERFHLQIEAKRLAYHDRDSYLGDPLQTRIPTAQMLSRAHADKLRGLIKSDQALREFPASNFPDHADTVYLCVVDREGNAVSFINSLFHSFGSAQMAPLSGVCLHSRGSSFVIDPGHPNCIAPNKRPLHTIIPGMLAKEGRAVMPFGVMGGHYQANGHTHLLTNLIDFEMDLQQAIDCPRLFAEQQGPVAVETGIPAGTRAALTQRGHTLIPTARPLGGGQAIWIDWQQGVLRGGSDPRKDGCALGY